MYFVNIGRSKSYWANQKPPVGSQIDLGHPLAQGLVYVGLFHNQLNTLQGKTKFIDSINEPSSKLVFTIDGWDNQGYPTTSSKILKPTIPSCSAFSVFAKTKWINGPFNEFYFLSQETPSLNVAYYTTQLLLSRGSTQFSSTGVVGTSQKSGIISACFIAPASGNSKFIVNNNVLLETNCGTNALVGSESSNLRLGTMPGLYNEDYYKWRGYIAQYYVWNRAISENENRELAYFPYQFLYVPTPRTFFIGGAAGGGAVAQNFSSVKSRITYRAKDPSLSAGGANFTGTKARITSRAKDPSFSAGNANFTGSKSRVSFSAKDSSFSPGGSSFTGEKSRITYRAKTPVLSPGAANFLASKSRIILTANDVAFAEAVAQFFNADKARVILGAHDVEFQYPPSQNLLVTKARFLLRPKTYVITQEGEDIDFVAEKARIYIRAKAVDIARYKLTFTTTAPEPTIFDNLFMIRPAVAKASPVLGATRPITMVGSYVSVPPFNYTIPTPWLGASYIVAEFAFNISRSTVIKALSGVPTSPSFLLAVRTTDNQGRTVRYKLWEDVGEVLYADLYQKNTISPSFVLEAWTIPSATEINLASLLTVKLGLKYSPKNCADIADREEDESTARTTIWADLREGLPLNLVNAYEDGPEPTLVDQDGNPITTDLGERIITY